jgi:predicted phosphodiesterase
VKVNIKHIHKIEKMLNSAPAIAAILLIVFFVLVSGKLEKKSTSQPNIYPISNIEKKGETPLPGNNITDFKNNFQSFLSRSANSGLNDVLSGNRQKQNLPAEAAIQPTTAVEQPVQENSEETNEDATVADNPQVTDSENESAETKKEAPPRPDLTIGLVADAHAGQSYGFGGLGGFAWKMNNYVQPDIIVDLGDLIESRKNYKYISKKDAEADYRRASAIMGRYPLYHVIGNHEVLSMSKDNLKSLTGRGSYYSVNVKGYNIIVLDTNYTEKEEKIDAKHADDFIYTGTIPDNQKKWLEDKLKSNSRNLIFVHHPLYNLNNENDIERVIKNNKSHVLLIANGHKHPSSLRVTTFGGVRSYDIPSLRYSGNQYSVIRINGSNATVTTR